LSFVFGSAIESGAELNKSRDAVVNLLDGQQTLFVEVDFYALY